MFNFTRSLIKIADYKKKPVGSSSIHQVFFLRTLILTNLFQISKSKKKMNVQCFPWIFKSFVFHLGVVGFRVVVAESLSVVVEALEVLSAWSALCFAASHALLS